MIHSTQFNGSETISSSSVGYRDALPHRLRCPILRWVGMVACRALTAKDTRRSRIEAREVHSNAQCGMASKGLPPTLKRFPERLNRGSGDSRFRANRIQGVLLEWRPA